MKYSSIIKAFNDYLSVLFKMDIEAALEAQNIMVLSSMVKKEEVISLQLSNLNFISLCREYNNYITTLLEGDAYIKELFSLVAFTETKTITELRIRSEYKDDFRQTRKIMLLMLMAYPSIHIGLTESSTIM